MNGRTPQQLQSTLDQYFNLSELRDLAFKLGIDHENLPGTTKGEFIRALIAYCQRHDLTKRLNQQVDQRLDASGSGSRDTVLRQNDDGRTAVWLALALVVVAVVAILIMQLWPEPAEAISTPSADKILLQVQVNNAEDLSAISNAKVSLTVAEQLFSPERTDSNGRAVFSLPAELAGEIARITVEANSQVERQTISLDFGMGAVEFQIRP